MAFGSTAKQKQTQSNGEKKVFDPVFLQLPKNGYRIVRFLGDEVQVKRFFWKNVNLGQDKPGEKPIIVGVSKVDVDGETSFFGHDGCEFWDNPISDYYAANYSKDEINKNGYYPASRFYINVLDRTPVLKTAEGVVLYPEVYLDDEGDVKEEYKGLGDPVPHNKVLILEQSSGKEGGKHYYNMILAAGKNLRNKKTGKKMSIDQSDFRLTNVPGNRTWNNNPVIDRNVYPDDDQNPIPSTIDTTLWDLEEWLQPWPHAAIQDILDGRLYSEVVEEYGIKQFPIKVGDVRTKGKTVSDNDEDLPF